MDLRLFIGIPSGETWHRLFGMSLALTMGHMYGCGVKGFDGIEVKIDNARGSILSRSRERIVEHALSWKASHLLFLDSDMVFPFDTVSRLVSWRKWVVAANCATKMLPASPTARRANNKHGGTPVFTDPDSSGLEKVWRVGTGVMMIDLKVFTKIKKPWFPITYRPEVNDYEGEDWAFCSALEKAGIALYVDHDLSKHVGHVGEFTYTHEYIGEVVQDANPAVPA